MIKLKCIREKKIVCIFYIANTIRDSSQFYFSYIHLFLFNFSKILLLLISNCNKLATSSSYKSTNPNV